MKISRKVIMLAAILFLTGCSRHILANQEKEEPVSAKQEEAVAQEQKEELNEAVSVQEKVSTEGDHETSSFFFQMTTFYGDTNGNDFHGGYLQSGILKTGDQAVLVKSDGTSYKISIQRIALYDEEDKLNPIPAEEAKDDSLTFIWLEGELSDQLQYGDILLGIKEWEQGISIDFPFESKEEYSLALAPQEEEAGRGELRLYDKEGEILQRISYGVFTEPLYYILFRNDRRNLVIFPDKESPAGRFLEWDGSRFLELEADIKSGQTPSAADLLFTEETETRLLREIYRPHIDDKEAEIIRYYDLQKETGELEIWDCLDEKSLFQKIVPMEDGIPVNERYYQVVFTEGLYSWMWEGEEESVPVDLCLKSSDEWFAEYENREAFLSDYGFTNSAPIYQYHDSLGNLRLELYRDEANDLFAGLTYRYFYDSKKQKYTRASGFAVDILEDEEWADDTYSVMSSIDSYGYEKETEYTPDNRPSYFCAKGPAVTVSEAGEIVTMMSILYIYRDDGTLYSRIYHHDPYQFSSYRQRESSLYDERERLVYENAYITHGIMEDYYIYLDEGDKPAYHIVLDYAGGAAPNTSMERYR